VTPEERAAHAVGWVVVSHRWAANLHLAVEQQIRAAIAEEREACARVAELYQDAPVEGPSPIAAAIRARGVERSDRPAGAQPEDA